MEKTLDRYSEKDMTAKAEDTSIGNRALPTVTLKINHEGGKYLPIDTSGEQDQLTVTLEEDMQANRTNLFLMVESNYSAFEDRVADENKYGSSSNSSMTLNRDGRTTATHSGDKRTSKAPTGRKLRVCETGFGYLTDEI